MRRVDVRADQLRGRLWLRYRLYDRLWHQLGGLAPGLEDRLWNRLYDRLYRQLGDPVQGDLCDE